MSVAAHRTEQVGQGAAARVPVQLTIPADPLSAPPRRVRVYGYTAPPTRRRVAGAPRVVVSTTCRPRQRISALSLITAGAAVCLAVIGLGALAGAGAVDVPARTEVVRVQPGETLSDLAARMAPSSDRGAVVDRIRELNALDAGLRPGQPLRVPAEG
ncbi:LysM peptidoglycan-binding domain-containing protein [Actinophytocola xinjiangensis]|uniref:LysM peptidoglycan-binding domain-containing protein n=1 Tax=Actinophytocola xinjiangensis TaxID=485602 RepID=UPI000A8194BE|nr:LysM peptidoglycan-binding domain-containing protein [Actinophytocola xinjiangensis]